MRAVSRTLFALLATGAVLGMVACGSSDSGDTGAAGSDTQSQQASSEGPIVIGAAIDQTGILKEFDGPALKAAELQAQKINENGGVDGREIEFKVKNTQLDPAKTKSAAEELISEGAEILWVSCDVDWATPSIQVGLKDEVLTVSPCISTDQMGPKRFGAAGELAYSFGNVAQDEGAALAKLFEKRGWGKAAVLADQSIAYFPDVCNSFKNRFEENGGEVVSDETFSEGDGTINSIVNRVNASSAEGILVCAAPQSDLPTFVAGVRSTGNQTPIAGPWSLDGSYWLPKDPQVANNIWLTTYASIYGDDPDPELQELIEEVGGGAPVGSSGFVPGASAIDGIVAAIEENGGSTEGKALAESMQGFEGLETAGGEVTFSSDIHTVQGRTYRVIEVKNGEPMFVELIEAGTPAEL